MKQKDKIIIYNTDDGNTSVALYAKNGDIWMNQNQIAELFDTSVPNISMHIKNIFKDWELSHASVVKDYLTTGPDGKNYQVDFYSLKMVLAIGFRVRSFRGIQFRQWAMKNLEEYMIKGFIMDDERLKNPDGRDDYFDELLARVREVRSSEKRFYQKLRDLFALSSDYDTTDKATQMFFAEVQNKLLYAVTWETATQIIMSRADATAENMNLTNWKGKQPRKQDIFIAKNYLSEKELDDLNRLVTVFLEIAEMRASNREDITIVFWRESVDKLLVFSEKEVLIGTKWISHEEMKSLVIKIYDTFDTSRRQENKTIVDRQDMLELNQIEQKIAQKL